MTSPNQVKPERCGTCRSDDPLVEVVTTRHGTIRSPISEADPGGHCPDDFHRPPTPTEQDESSEGRYSQVSGMSEAEMAGPTEQEAEGERVPECGCPEAGEAHYCEGVDARPYSPAPEDRAEDKRHAEMWKGAPLTVAPETQGPLDRAELTPLGKTDANPTQTPDRLAQLANAYNALVAIEKKALGSFPDTRYLTKEMWVIVELARDGLSTELSPTPTERRADG